MLGVKGFKFKKDLVKAVGVDFRPHVIETSFFGLEYPAGGTGKFAVANDPHGKRNWFATVHVKDNLIVKVT